MEEKNKKGLRFNIIDVVIILVIIGCLVGIVLRLNIKKIEENAEASGYAATYTLRLSGISNASDFTLQENDTIYDTKTKQEIGVVKSIEKVPAMRNITMADGSIAYVEMQEYDDYDVTVDCYILPMEKGYYISGEVYCAVGNTLYFRSATFSANGAITSFTVHE